MVFRALSGMLRRLGARGTFPLEPGSPGGYRAFTRRYDQEIAANNLDVVLGPLGPAAQAALDEANRTFEECLGAWNVQASMQGLLAVQEVRRVVPDAGLKDCVVSLLIDHSGSMRGVPILMAAAAVRVTVDLLRHLGVSVEVLGYTTTNWKGGKSRQAWIRAGKPEKPGRLCDLLHIIYRDANEPDFSQSSFGNMLRGDLLKENIDGEAIEWAAGRLTRTGKTHKILVIVSDGASVDDSTLVANANPRILEQHILEVVAELESKGDIALGAIGIGYGVHRYYPRSAKIQTPDELGTALPAFVGELLREVCAQG